MSKSTRFAAALTLVSIARTAGNLPAQLAPGVNTGYAAKMLCSTLFVSHRPLAVAPGQDLRLAARVPYRVDSASRSVVAWIPGLEARRAVFQDRLGCTLRPDSSLGPVAARGRPSKPPTLPQTLWPAGERIDTTRLPAGVNTARLGAALDSAFAEPGVDSTRRTRGIVVAWNGHIVAEHYAKGFDATTPQLGWSMTKSVTNALVGTLVKQGRLAADRPADVPEWKGAGDPRSAIRLDDLMRMSSGLAFDETYTGVASDVAKDLFMADDAGAYAASLPLADPIGSRWSYSSGTTNITSRPATNGHSP